MRILSFAFSLLRRSSYQRLYSIWLFRIIDPDIESSGKHIDECRQIDPRAVDAAYGSREMQCRFQFHDIRRRELFGEEQRRFRDFDRYRGGDGRITKPGKD